MPCANVYLQNKFHDPQDLHLFPISSLLSNYNEILIENEKQSEQLEIFG